MTLAFPDQPGFAADLVRGVQSEHQALKETWAWQELMVCPGRMENLVHLVQLAKKESLGSVASWDLKVWWDHRESSEPEGILENQA